MLQYILNDEGTVDPGTIVGTLLSTLTGGVNYNNIPVRELPENIQTIENIFGNPELPEAINQLSETTDDPARPKAHLNYVVFNDEMRLDPENSGALQVPMGGNGWTTMQKEVQIQTPGYIFVYVDNQSLGKDVWFDNIHLEHYTSQVLEQNHYYPHGLTISEDGAKTGAEQVYKYQGVELNKYFGLETFETFYRGLDPQIGRFRQVDPMSDNSFYQSPYASMDDNPISNTDPDGKYSRFGAWWRNEMWGGSGIKKVKKTGEWGVTYKQVDLDGRSRSHFQTRGEKAMSLEEGKALLRERWKNIQNGLEMGTIYKDENGNYIRAIDGKPLDAEMSGQTRAKSFLNMLEPALFMVSPFEGANVAAKTGTNLIPEGKLANHLFKGAGKLADNPVNRTLIQKIANGKPLGVDAYGRSWYMGVDGAGKSVYTYTQNGLVKEAGYATMTPAEMIAKYGLK